VTVTRDSAYSGERFVHSSIGNGQPNPVRHVPQMAVDLGATRFCATTVAPVRGCSLP
jgi:hypothetical protein